MKQIIYCTMIFLSLFQSISFANTKELGDGIKSVCNNAGGEKDKICVQYVEKLISLAIDQGKISYLCDEWSKKGHDVTKEQRCIDAKEFESYFNKK
ncbi:hypothetical protein [Citrobacter sedlakii]|uniref:hypothetical protein n=1 Tax=Citrobacter sedlakii TaxID=67826 RepID=UPI00128787E2|nr:hypothetical protein [Citrobacter sedlakii]EBJ8256705.1 hypothetical protein [Salmonella enterica]EBS4350998.1 hypothetical protein [Salmonella enterica subsp. enterica serovar Galiema]ECX1051457.1 hypothetical protein [Salmonella enterica subsp. enterica serovar Senftenberg]EDT5944258.1 hypothetical protein [Salmonella enterica subsp. enterica serovar Oranienburg]EBM7014053.1 hypothetical protein [Salmonella enterica]